MITVTCARAGCGITKAVRKRTQVYCSHRCDILARSAASKREAGVRGGLASGRARWKRAIETWRQKYPGVSWALAREIYLRGYNAGHRKGRGEARKAVAA